MNAKYSWIRLVGFEELGNSDAFDTAVLELRLSSCGTFGLFSCVIDFSNS